MARIRAAEAVELPEDLVGRSKIGPVTGRPPARASRAVGDLIKDSRRRPLVMQFPAGRPELGASACGTS